MSIENRNTPRAPLDIYVNKFIRGTPFMARAKDISVEGIYLTQLIEPVDCDLRIGIQFQLPGDDEVIYAEGIAVREGENGQGILFTLLSERHRRLIREYIQRFIARNDVPLAPIR